MAQLGQRLAVTGAVVLAVTWLVPGAAAAFVPVSDRSCRVRSNGTVACWGNNSFGEASPPGGTFSRPSVDAGDGHICGVRNDGTVACWGFDDYGQATPPGGTFTQVSSGGLHTCGVRSDGTVACWGWDGYGQASPPGGTFTQVSAGYASTCGVRTDGTMACWGYNGDGQASPPGGMFTEVSTAVSHTCGVRSDGTVACWGNNSFGQASPPAGTFTQVSAGFRHTCGVRGDGSLACWGYDLYGQASPPGGTFTQVSAGEIHTCGLRAEGTLACWGYTGHGRATPPAGIFTQVSAGRYDACAVRSDGTVACWGSEDFFGNFPAGPSITSPAPPGATLGASYNHQITTTFESPAATFSVTAGTLPTGLGLSPSGLISGAPTTGGSFGPLTVCATNGLAPAACQTLTIVVSASKAGATLSTQASPSVLAGGPVRDTAALSGGSNPTGSITFRLYGPDDTGCSGAVVFASTVPVSGNGSYGSASFTTAAPGTYRWTATYTGDAANDAATSRCGAANESVVVRPFAPPRPSRSLSGDVTGPVTVNAGESVVVANARVSGGISVSPGGALSVTSSQVAGGIVATDPSFFSLCGSQVAAPRNNPARGVVVYNAGVPVRIGDPATGCATNRVAGGVSLANNSGGLTFGSNIVSRDASVDTNTVGAAVIKANTVFGVLGCTGNTPPPTNAGQPNAAGAKAGQCAGL